ncbi:MAG: hypothetical protein KAJ10_07290 [Thermodesulfovibrionia bacterium]|nr:hypothetical protein [Thermodesulfovibrionia bacterium]
METPNETTQTAAAEAAAPTMADIEKQYFSPVDLNTPETQATINKVNAILAAAGVKPTFNFDPAKGVEPGFGIAIVPITERVAERGNVTKGCAIVQVPDPQTVAAHEKGAEFINKSILGKLVAKVSNAVRSASASIPASMEDFLVSTRSGEGLATYRELAPGFVKGLKKMGISIMNTNLLRQIFSSKEFAEDQFPKIPQEKWEYLLNLMVDQAGKKNLDPAILNHWKETRNVTEMTLADDFDTEAFGELIS